MAVAGRFARASEVFGIASAILAAVFFGTAYIATAFAIRSFTPMGAAMWRGLLATVVLALVAWLTLGRRRPQPLDWPRFSRLVVLGLTGGLGFVSAMNLSVSMAGATLAGFAASLAPVLAAVLAPLILRERLGLASACGFAVAVAGTALLIGTDASDVGPGVLAGLFAACCFAVFLLLSRRWSRKYHLSPTAIALSIAATTALGLLPIELLREPAELVPQDLRVDAALGVIWLALVPGVLAQLFVVASVRRVEVRSSGAMLLISPVTTAVLAAWMLGESLQVPQVIGAAMILGGVAGAAVFGRSTGAELG